MIGYAWNDDLTAMIGCKNRDSFLDDHIGGKNRDSFLEIVTHFWIADWGSMIGYAWNDDLTNGTVQ
jgi:hypothetical protein